MLTLRCFRDTNSSRLHYSVARTQSRGAVMKSAVVKSSLLSLNRQSLMERLRSKVGTRFKKGLHARHLSYGLRRDLDIAFTAPKARIPISVRPLVDEDVAILFPADPSAIDDKEQTELNWRKAFLESNIGQCFVAVDERNGEPCYFQWLIGPRDNDRLAPLKMSHRLADDEALLENAYTPVHYRAKGIMPAAMAHIAERARESSLRYVTTFVGVENTPSLKGCVKAGFQPCLIRQQTSFAFDTVRLIEVRNMAPEDAPGVLNL